MDYYLHSINGDTYVYAGVGLGLPEIASEIEKIDGVAVCNVPTPSFLVIIFRPGRGADKINEVEALLNLMLGS